MYSFFLLSSFHHSLSSATIAQDYDKFWVGETSDRVQVVPQDQIGLSNGISTTRRPIQSTTPNFVKPLVKANSNRDTFYDGCGENKTCFGKLSLAKFNSKKDCYNGKNVSNVSSYQINYKLIY